MKAVQFILIVSTLVAVTTSCEKNRIENNCCSDEYRILTTRYVEPDSFDLFIPQAFTPNGDGMNDYFTPLGRGYEVEEMIVSRGRKEVFNLKDHVEPFWDGGDEKDGSYDYNLKLRLRNNELIEVEGSVCILRPSAVNDNNYELKRTKICDCLMPDMIDNRQGPIYDTPECPEGSTYDQTDDE